MSLQLRRGTEAQRTEVTFAQGEPVWTTDTNKLYVGDGVTPGGIVVTNTATGVAYDQSLNTTDNVEFNQIRTTLITATNTLTFVASSYVGTDRPSMLFRAGLVEFYGVDNTLDLRVQDGQIVTEQIVTEIIKGGLELSLSSHDGGTSKSGSIFFNTDFITVGGVPDIPAIRFNVTNQNSVVDQIAIMTATNSTFYTPVSIQNNLRLLSTSTLFFGTNTIAISSTGTLLVNGSIIGAKGSLASSNFRGAFTYGGTYAFNDIVEFSGSTFVMVNPAGTYTDDPNNDTTNWKLVASKGNDGDQGFSGISGEQGIQGESGISGYSGFSGYSGVGGDQGIQGESGISGYSGYSGISGAQGIQGETGVSGAQGIQGETGVSGYSGISGFSGESGISGYSGISGFSGESGYSGISGFSGVQGPAGPGADQDLNTTSSVRFANITATNATFTGVITIGTDTTNTISQSGDNFLINSTFPGGIVLDAGSSEVIIQASEGLRAPLIRTPNLSGGIEFLTGWLFPRYASTTVGNNASPFKDLYLSSTGTVFFGTNTVAVNSTGTLLVNGLEVSGDTGDITFDGVKIQGAGSAGESGYSTIELVPDTDLYTISTSSGAFGNSGGQYLIIDPTSPQHIHIRAGGPIDQAPAQLILGGEKANVTVRDQDNSYEENHYVTINTESTASTHYSWIFGDDGGLTFPDTTIQSTAFTGTGDIGFQGNWIRNTGTEAIFISPQDGVTGLYLPNDDSAHVDAVNLFNADTTGTVSISAGSQVWIFSHTGGLTFPDSTVQTTAGGTSVYERGGLPMGTPGQIITISDSGTDDNSPAGNWAPAYWDDDATEWVYIGNSNSVTAI